MCKHSALLFHSSQVINTKPGNTFGVFRTMFALAQLPPGINICFPLLKVCPSSSSIGIGREFLKDIYSLRGQSRLRCHRVRGLQGLLDNHQYRSRSARSNDNTASKTLPQYGKCIVMATFLPSSLTWKQTSRSLAFLPARPSSEPQRRLSEVSLGGPGTDWDVHFAATEDLSDAITFRRGVDDTGFAGTSRHTLSIFGVDGSIKFRDSRSLAIRRPDREGRVRNLDISVWASVVVTGRNFQVVRHEENGDDWITVIKLRPGRMFTVQNSPLAPTLPRKPLLLTHTMLRLWTMRLEIQTMPYMAIVVRDHRNYTPWLIVLRREMLGPLVVTSAQTATETPPPPSHTSSAINPPPPTSSTSPIAGAEAGTQPAVETNDADNDPASDPKALIDLASEGRRPSQSPTDAGNGVALQETGPSPKEQEPEQLPAQEPEQEEGETKTSLPKPSSDPFRNIWEHALTQARSDKGRGSREG